MIICKKCKSDVVYDGTLCPVCKTPLVIDDADIRRAKAELDAARLDTKNPDRFFSLCNLLADGGDTDGQREFAKLLETGCELLLTEYDPTNVYRTKLKEGELLVKLPVESPKTEVPVIELFLK